MTERGGVAASGGATQLVFKQGANIPEDIRYDEESGRGDSSPIDEANDRAAAGTAEGALPKPKGVFSWHHLNYDIPLSGGETRRLLDDVSGYVAPGKLVSLLLLELLSSIILISWL